jgi:acetylornithine deacetylase/succinyl-diaminopimelate desuccinylase-like protein
MKKILTLLPLLVLLNFCAISQELPQGHPELIDFSKSGKEVIKILQDMIRFRTVNSPPDKQKICDILLDIKERSKELWAPALEQNLGKFIKEEFQKIEKLSVVGNELELIKYVHKLFKKEGIESEIIKSTKNRANLIAKIYGNKSKRPMLVMAHIDVVDAKKEHWIVNPFSGKIQDGYIYGRGAIDDKGMAACAVAVMLLLKRSNAKLSRDVILLLCADEEAGGRYGIKHIIKNYRDKIDAEFAINEGGEILATEDGRPAILFLQYAEKQYVDIKLKVKGKGGHSSIPHRENPVEILSRAIAQISMYKTEPKFTKEVKLYFDGMSKLDDNLLYAIFKGKVKRPQIPSLKKWMADIATGTKQQAQKAAELLSLIPHFNAMLRNTITATIIKAGFRANVIPSFAEATLNARLLPGESVEKFVKEIKEVVGNKNIEVVARALVKKIVPPSPVDHEVFKKAQKVLGKMAKGAVVIPCMSAGATDSRELRAIGIPTYGLLPMPLTLEDIEKMHAENERVPVKSMEFGVEFLYRLIWELAK